MRIRTIKPEFWTSESNGRLSRDARLLFLALLSHADDEGRFAASSRALASLLFPFDEDSHSLVDGWIAELEREGKVRRWTADGNTYGEIPNFLKHQRIDRPSRSKLPRFDESSRALASPRCWIRDQGSGIRDQGSGNREERQGALTEVERAAPRREKAAKEKGRSGSRRPASENPDPGPRASDLLCEDFLQATGGRYVWQGGKDGAALAHLLKHATLEEIRRRWRAGLAQSGWLHTATVAQLRAKWNDLGAAPLPQDEIDRQRREEVFRMLAEQEAESKRPVANGEGAP